MSLVNITLSFLLYLAGPLLMLLSLLMFRSCLLNQIYLFQDKSFKTQTMTQQGRQLLDVDEMSMSNLDWAGQKRLRMFKSPGTVIGKGQHS
jgi:hypothetical protein